MMGRMILALALSLVMTHVATADGLTPDQQKGKEVYDKRCAGCHGAEGGGDGPAADRLRPMPRNFKAAKYKFTFNQFGKLPQDSTIARWIADGLPGTSMPGWKDLLSEQDIRNVVAYIKTFSKKFERAEKAGERPAPIKIGSPPKWTEDDIKRGRELFQKNCEKCHGEAGRGSGPSSVGLKDDLGDRIWPRNLTKGWTFRGGSAPGDIYRTVAGGITGTPMPAHLSASPEEKGAMTEDEIWKVAGYVSSIVQRERPQITEVVVSKFAIGALPDDPKDERWSHVEPRYFPMVSQIIEGDRWFKTTLESVFVRSMYNDKEIAILVEWDDPSKSPLPQPNEQFPENEPDALAIQLPTAIPSGMEKPYFLGGGEKAPVTLWKWANGQEPEVLLGKGILKTAKAPGERQTVKVKTDYAAGHWRAVFTRPLKAAAPDDLTFEPGKYIPIAFSAWDGNNGEKDEKRAITIWYWLLLEPPTEMTVYLFPVFAGLLVAAGEAVLVIRTRTRNNGKGLKS